MTEKMRPQAAEVFSHLDDRREKRRIPSRFAETRDELLNRDEQKLSQEGKFVKYGVPIRTRFATPTPEPTSVPENIPDTEDFMISSPDEDLEDAPVTPSKDTHSLTPKQSEVVELFLKGMSTGAICEILGITRFAYYDRMRFARTTLGIDTALGGNLLKDELREKLGIKKA